MRIYKVILTCNDTENSNNIDHYTEHSKEVSEEIFNAIYKLLV